MIKVPRESIYALAADTILVSHVLFVLFVVFGVVAIYVGHWLSWGWVRNFWFRILHLGAITIVVLQSWVGVFCPLTVWEMQLRERAGATTYEGSFLQYWLQTVLYYEAPAWVFILCYTLIGGLVLAGWFIVRPRHHV